MVCDGLLCTNVCVCGVWVYPTLWGQNERCAEVFDRQFEDPIVLIVRIQVWSQALFNTFHRLKMCKTLRQM